MKKLLSFVIVLVFPLIAAADDWEEFEAGGTLNAWSSGSAWSSSEGENVSNAAGAAGFTSLTVESPLGFSEDSSITLQGFYQGQGSSSSGDAWAGGGYDGMAEWETEQWSFSED